MDQLFGKQIWKKTKIKEKHSENIEKIGKQKQIWEKKGKMYWNKHRKTHLEKMKTWKHIANILWNKTFFNVTGYKNDSLGHFLKGNTKENCRRRDF